MAETKKTAAKKSSPDREGKEMKAARQEASKPITGSGLAGVSQDDLNPAFAPPKD